MLVKFRQRNQPFRLWPFIHEGRLLDTPYSAQSWFSGWVGWAFQDAGFAWLTSTTSSLFSTPHSTLSSTAALDRGLLHWHVIFHLGSSIKNVITFGVVDTADTIHRNPIIWTKFDKQNFCTGSDWSWSGCSETCSAWGDDMASGCKTTQPLPGFLTWARKWREWYEDIKRISNMVSLC